MENFLFSVNVVLPVVLICILGYFLKSIGLIQSEFNETASKIVFNIALPCSIFGSIAYHPIKELFNPGLILFALISIVISAAILTWIIPKFVNGAAKSASIVQGIFRSNFVLLGIALAENMFGKDGDGSFPTMMIIPFAVSLFSILSVMIFSYLIPNAGSKKTSGIRTTLVILKNPLVIASAVSIAFGLLQWQPPAPVASVIDTLGKLANPLVLIMLGSQFELRSARDNLKYTIPASFCKLILIPVVFMSIAVIIGFRGPELGALFILFSTPSAVTSYIMAKNMGGDEDIAGQMVCLTTIFSAFTMVLGIFILKSFNLI